VVLSAWRMRWYAAMTPPTLNF